MSDSVKHPPQVRYLTVVRTARITPSIARVTLVGDDLTGFNAPGFDDHVKIYLPDSHGEISAPALVGGSLKHTGKKTSATRDYTVRAFRDAVGDRPAELDIDFVLHGHGREGEGASDGAGGGGDAAGPASEWAADAGLGDPLVITGPKRSELAPTWAKSAVIIADETGFPAAARLIVDLGDVPIVCLFAASTECVDAYFAEVPGRERLDLRVVKYPEAADEHEAALRNLSIDAETFVFAAGEKHLLAPLRRYLKKQLELPKQQLSMHGYWKRSSKHHT
ncbi:siderophore-interacting protein [Leucobacter denitrificans]|uniref:Siderophore-interacting protein n=1 Tax=Leucobacter denitrificans TaxID=683042 RepID=A0A7G9S233_9MICO|nr:siderophore-interacting protein [Leucobacter denitrificans]QNN61908.1 siderophore-interacting protein [Leucobacter denitrificans]